MSSIVVVGSANLDVVVRTPRRPRPGETVTGTDIVRGVGGKGVNQAVAAARLGGHVAMLASVGDDDAGDRLVHALKADGVNTSAVATVPEPTGTAHIVVDDDGENAIVVIPGANAARRGVTDDEARLLAGADLVLGVLEVPISRVTAAFEAAPGATRVLTPAPAVPLPAALVAATDIMLLNQSEALIVGDEAMAKVPDVVVTLGADGCRWRGRDGAELTVGADSVTAVDTTGAGDCFAGALAVALAERRAMPDALAFAVRAAGLQVTRAGAAEAMPVRAEVEDQA